MDPGVENVDNFPVDEKEVRAADRIFDIGKRIHDPVKSQREKFAQPGIFPIQTVGNDDLLPLFPETVHVDHRLIWLLFIVHHRHRASSFADRQAGENRIMAGVVATQLICPDITMLFLKFECHLIGIISGTIIDDDEFKRDSFPVEQASE